MEEKTVRVLGLAIVGLSVVASSAILAPALRGGRSAPPAASRASTPDERAIEGRYATTDAGVRVVEFLDFECPGCQALHTTMEELRRKYPGRFSLSYRHFPLDIHPHARMAAIAAECASQQRGFDEFQRLAFQNQDSVRAGAWWWFADRAAISDSVAFDRCLHGVAAQAVVTEDVAMARRLRLLGTPVLIVGDSVIMGSRSLEAMESILGLASIR